MRTNRPIAAALAAAALLLAGCAGGTEPPAAATTAEQDPAVSDGDAAPDDTASGDDAAADEPVVPAAEDAGEPADPADATRTIAVDALDTMAFDPERIEVAAGETVTFVVTNVGQTVHEFTLGDADEQRAHAEQMAEMGSMPHDEPNAISLEPGETGELTWRFGSPGSVEFACHEPGHYDAGMSGAVVVG